jgi:two-component system NarL family response regulator
MSSLAIVDVFVLAENRLLREALLRVFAKKNEIRVVGSNSYTPDIHEQIMATTPAIIVLDSIGLSRSSAQLISTIRSAIPDVKLVMVDMDADELTFLRAIREGVVGYVLKDASAIELVSAIRSVAAGEAICPPSLTAALFRYASRPPNTVSSISWGAELGLSRREQQLMTLLRDGLTNKEIASQLSISEQTVKNHVHNIMHKLGARDRLSAVRRCEVLRFEVTGT